MPNPPSGGVVAGPHGRVPPHNLDAERSLLGGIFIDGQTLAELRIIVKPDDFYRDAHRKIFEAMCRLDDRNEPVDRVTLKVALTPSAFEAVGGDEYIDLLDKYVPTAANLSYYAKIVADKALARRLIETAGSIAQLGYEQHGDVEAFADECERRIMAIVEQRQSSSVWRPVKKILVKAFAHLEELHAKGDSITGMPTGLTDLDLLTGGLHKGQLVVLGARPKMGKSMLALQIAMNVAATGVGVGFFSLEMTEDEIGPRLLVSEGRVNSLRVRSGNLLDSDWAKLAKAAGEMGDLPFYLDDGMHTTVLAMRTKARQLKRKLEGEGVELGLLVVDYLQLAGEFGENREQEIAAVSRGLKMLAKELGICVLALAQLNRALEKRTDRRPIPSDLRDSGSLEQDADAVLFLYRDEVYYPDTNDKGVAELNIALQRNGPPGPVKLAYLGEHMRFGDLARGPNRELPPYANDPPMPPPPHWAESSDQ